MNDIFIDKRLYIDKSRIENAGYGVFTESFIKKDTIIEISKILKVANSNVFQKDNILNDYIFKFDDNHSGVALGYGGLYNHSDNPNIKYTVVEDKIIFQATRDIFTREEICNSYGKQYWEIRKNK